MSLTFSFSKNIKISADVILTDEDMQNIVDNYNEANNEELTIDEFIELRDDENLDEYVLDYVAQEQLDDEDSGQVENWYEEEEDYDYWVSES